ncbi:RidA family protein [Aureimonas populi]|uniref:RidA family protein n=1 Tax=Aureimonas populi TaxID=1701758 RepID=A0ABW5CL78_9HYPH|nr:RidA family protein [Aureimonas populi]
MPKQFHNPGGRAAPLTYHHAVEVSGAVHTLYLAGQIGLRADGTVPSDFAQEAAAVFDNLELALAEAGMSLADIVRTTVFMTRPQDREAFSHVRAERMGGHKPASTLVYVAGLARPELRLEIEAIAVAED